MALDYISKNRTIINYSITATDSWEQAASEDKAVRGWFIKAKNDTDNSFQLAFSDNPSTFLTSDGSGFRFDEESLPNVWVRTQTSGTIIEIYHRN